MTPTTVRPARTNAVPERPARTLPTQEESAITLSAQEKTYALPDGNLFIVGAVFFCGLVLFVFVGGLGGAVFGGGFLWNGNWPFPRPFNAIRSIPSELR